MHNEAAQHFIASIVRGCHGTVPRYRLSVGVNCDTFTNRCTRGKGWSNKLLKYLIIGCDSAEDRGPEG